MSDHSKNNLQMPEGQKTPTAPVWIFALTLLFLFIGGVYYDRHSGWFDAQVYAPYHTADELEAYQPKSGAAALFAQGQRSYSSICAACHGDNGQGKPGQAPPLAGSEWVTAESPNRVIQIPQRGLNGQITVAGQAWSSQMAAMGAGLSDSDYAAVLTYIRGAWGNKASAVSADDVKAMRTAVAGKSAINGEAELKTIK